MKISVVQFKPEFGNLELNSSRIFNYCQNIDSTIIVFPELSFSGYDFINREECISMAEEFNTKYTKIIQEISSDLNKIICVGFAEIQGEKLFNSAAVCFPKPGFSTTYQKVHLFFRERFIFNESENGYNVIKYPDLDINIGPMICYDWRFPEASRTHALKGADIILCPSNLVTNVWHISTPSRALENKVYFAVANRIGDENRNDINLHFNGGSVIHSYNGSDLAKAGLSDEEIITAEINPSDTRHKSFNEFNDIFTDRRPQFYSI
jgi:predicted amidohydrolase